MADLHFPFETLKLVDTIVESSPQTLFVYVLAMIVVLATLEQVLFTYRRIKYGLEGPTFVVPFIGGVWNSGSLRRHGVEQAGMEPSEAAHVTPIV